MRTKLGLLRELRSILIGDITWLEEQKALYANLIRQKNELLYDVEAEIHEELTRLKPVSKGQPVAIEFIGNPDD
jgi:hypothetical protein